MTRLAFRSAGRALVFQCSKRVVLIRFGGSLRVSLMVLSLSELKSISAKCGTLLQNSGQNRRWNEQWVDWHPRSVERVVRQEVAGSSADARLVELWWDSAGHVARTDFVQVKGTFFPRIKQEIAPHHRHTTLFFRVRDWESNCGHIYSEGLNKPVFTSSEVHGQA